jgi:hypothetical protein
MNTNGHKTRAEELGLSWPAVLAVYREARAIETATVAAAVEFRRDAFRALWGDEHGGRFKIANRAAFNGGDATNVRAKLDVVAADRGMSADELFDILSADAPTLRPADDVMTETIDRCCELNQPAADLEYVGLVSAAAAADVTEQWLRQLVKAGKIRGRKAGRNWQVAAADVSFFQRHPTAGRPRLRAGLEPAPF